MGGKNQTSTSNSSQSYTPTGLSQLNDIWNKVQGVASTPYNPYGGQLTAGLDQTQQAGINTINSAQGTAQPYYNQATQYANQAAAPISASQIQNYQSPYTQQVVNAAQNQFNDSNAQQLQQVRGNAALQGALGGSRSAVAEAETARQQKLAQDPTIAGLYNQGYTQALGAAQQDRAAQAQAAYSLGSLGSAAQNTAISGGNAQLGAGAVAQGTTQAGLSAAYQQYLQQQAFPYQQAQFLASYGLPAATAQGGTQTGNSQTTQPGPSPWGQAAGIGLAGLSFLKDGGRVKGYASGGSPMGAENFILVPSYIPKSENAPQAQTPQMAPMQAPSFKAQGALGGPSPQDYADGLSGLGGLFGGSSDGWQGGTPLEGGAAPWQGGIGHAANGGRINKYANGGFIDTFNSIHRALGGAVTPSPFVQGYAEGGTPDFDSRWQDIDAANDTFNRPAAVASPLSVLNADTLGLDKPVNWSPAQQNAPQLVSEGATPQTIQSADLPPQITGDQQPSPYTPSSAMSFPAPDTTPADDGSTVDLSAQSKQPESKSGLLGLGLSKEARMGLLSAGLGALASRSPFALSAIGEGGQQGLGTYNQLTKQSQDQAVKQQEIGIRAKQLAQTASQFATTSGETKRYHDILDQQRKDALEERKTRAGYARNPDGTMSPIKGGPADPDQLAIVAKAKQTGALLPDETANFMADRVLSGDTKALIGLGRGAQGAENIAKIQTIVAKKAAEQGLNPLDIMARAAEQSGLNAQQRTFGNQVAKMAVNSTEAQGALELGRQASAAVPRGNWTPINKLIQAGQIITSDPKLLQFAAANLAIVNTYARAINPNGTPAVHDKEHAERLLSTATGPEGYNALLDQLNKEIEIAHAAPAKAKQELENIRKGGNAPTQASSAAPKQLPPGAVRQGGHIFAPGPDGKMKLVE